jgi:hypothetical protein
MTTFDQLYRVALVVRSVRLNLSNRLTAIMFFVSLGFFPNKQKNAADVI